MSANALQLLDGTKRRIAKLIRPSDIQKAKEEEKALKCDILHQHAIEQTKFRKIILVKPSGKKCEIKGINSCEDMISKEEMPPRKIAKSVSNSIDLPKNTGSSESDNENRQTVLVKSFEKNFDVLPVEDVEIIRLTHFQQGDKAYFKNPVTNALFTRLGPKSVGPLVGRWDSRKKCICIDIMDRDENEDF